MRRAEERVERLKTVDLFGSCTSRELRRIVSLMDRVDIPEGDVLIREGKAGAAEMFIIEQGIAKVTLRGRELTSLGPGDVFGEMALLDSGPRAATVRAETPMIVHVVGAREFATLLHEVPQIGRKILRGLARRLREVQRAPVA